MQLKCKASPANQWPTFPARLKPCMPLPQWLLPASAAAVPSIPTRPLHYTNHMATTPTGSAHATCGARGGAGAGDWAATVGAEPKGARAELGSSASGLGGLGLDGMVGATSDGGGEAAAASSAPGEGRTGIMSGESAGGRAECLGRRGRGYSGAAEMADVRSAPAGTLAHAAQSTARRRRRRGRRPRAWVLAIVCSLCALERVRVAARARGLLEDDLRLQRTLQVRAWESGVFLVGEGGIGWLGRYSSEFGRGVEAGGHTRHMLFGGTPHTL